MAAHRAHTARAFAIALLAICAALSGCGAAASSRRQHEAARNEAAARAVKANGAGGSQAGGTSPAPNVSGTGSRRPNIVFVLTDDLAWNLVRFMPHVLQLQREGETFSNYFVTDSLCCPSRASIFTGRFPHDTHVYDNSPPEGGYSVFRALGEERETFALELQRVGYRTALMGKYLNGYEPAAPADGARGYVPPGWNEWDVAGNGYPEYGYRMNSDGHVRPYGYAASDYLTNVLARRGLSFIDHAAADGRPFMLELATFAPHSPFTPAPRDSRSFPGLKAPRTPAFDVVGTDEPAWLSRFRPLLPGQIASIDHKFRRRAQAVQAVDRMIGEIEAELARRGLAKNTYIVFSSDNGLHMGEHRLLPGKLTAFDTDIRVPLIVAGPGVPAARTLDAMTENIDLCPTFEQLAGARVSASVDGHSLLGLLRGEPASRWRRAVLIEHHGRVLDAGDPDLPTQGAGNPPSYEAMRTPNSLYVEYDTGEREYYDLEHDPFELSNIVTQLPAARLQRLHETLVEMERCHGASACWRAERGRRGPGPPGPGADGVTDRVRKAIG